MLQLPLNQISNHLQWPPTETRANESPPSLKIRPNSIVNIAKVVLKMDLHSSIDQVYGLFWVTCCMQSISHVTLVTFRGRFQRSYFLFIYAPKIQ